MIDRLHPSGSAPVANVTPITGPGDASVDSYSWELLGMFSYLDMLAKENITMAGPLAQQYIAALKAAASGPSSAVDPQVYQLLQSFMAASSAGGAGGTFTTSWWTTQVGPSATNPDGFVFDWMAAHSDLNSGTDEASTAFATIMCMLDMESLGPTEKANAEAFFNFSTGGTRINPTITSILPYIEPMLFGYIWEQSGSPTSSSDPNWTQFTETLEIVALDLQKNSSLGPLAAEISSQFFADAQSAINSGTLPPDFTQASFDYAMSQFSLCFSAYLN